jgi:hypothetical protein
MIGFIEVIKGNPLSCEDPKWASFLRWSPHGGAEFPPVRDPLSVISLSPNKNNPCVSSSVLIHLRTDDNP